MKLTIIFSILIFLTISCNSQKEAEEPQGIMEENDMCICTTDYTPVCGEDGKTYPNACTAGCEKVKSTPGECSK